MNDPNVFYNFGISQATPEKMKAFSLVFFLFLFSFFSKSQTSAEERPYYYLGQYDNKNLYIKSLFSQRSNQVSLYELNDGEIIESEKIEVQNAIIHQLYCYQEVFYAITSSIEGNQFYMTSFDKFLKEKASVEIFSLTNAQLRGLKSKDFSMKFYQKKDRAAVAVIDNEITVCSINFSSFKSTTFKVPTGFNSNFISDIYLEDDLNLYLSQRDELFHFKNGNLAIVEMNYLPLQGQIDGFKFTEDDSEPYLVSMVLNGGSLKSFVYAPLNSESIRLKEAVLKPEKIGSQNKMKLSYNSFIKAEIRDNKLFCTVQRIEQAINETLLISCIEISKQENLWNFQVLRIHDAPYIWEENRNKLNQASFSFIQDDKLIFLFNAAVKNLDPENFFATDKRVVTYDISTQTTIIKAEIDIHTGENTTQPIHKDYQSESFKIFNSSYHIENGNELRFITYKEFNNKPYYEMLKPEKKVETIKL